MNDIDRIHISASISVTSKSNYCMITVSQPKMFVDAEAQLTFVIAIYIYNVSIKSVVIYFKPAQQLMFTSIIFNFPTFSAIINQSSSILTRTVTNTIQ